MWSAVVGALAVFPLFAIFRCLDQNDRRAAAATVVTVTCPLFWFMAVRPMSDIAEWGADRPGGVAFGLSNAGASAMARGDVAVAGRQRRIGSCGGAPYADAVVDPAADRRDRVSPDTGGGRSTNAAAEVTRDEYCSSPMNRHLPNSAPATQNFASARTQVDHGSNSQILQPVRRPFRNS